MCSTVVMRVYTTVYLSGDLLLLSTSIDRAIVLHIIQYSSHYQLISRINLISSYFQSSASTSPSVSAGGNDHHHGCQAQQNLVFRWLSQTEGSTQKGSATKVWALGQRHARPNEVGWYNSSGNLVKNKYLYTIFSFR